MKEGCKKFVEFLNISDKAVEELIKLAYEQGYSDCRGFKTKDYKKSIAYKELQKIKETK